MICISRLMSWGGGLKDVNWQQDKAIYTQECPRAVQSSWWLQSELPVQNPYLCINIKIVDLHLNGPFFFSHCGSIFFFTSLKALLGLSLNKPFLITGHFYLWKKKPWCSIQPEFVTYLTFLRYVFFILFNLEPQHFFPRPERDCPEHQLKLRTGTQCSFHNQQL